MMGMSRATSELHEALIEFADALDAHGSDVPRKTWQGDFESVQFDLIGTPLEPSAGRLLRAAEQLEDAWEEYPQARPSARTLAVWARLRALRLELACLTPRRQRRPGT